MKDTVTLMPFTVRVEDGREFAVYANGAASAVVGAMARSNWESPVVLVIRADEPFVRRKPKRHWLLRWLIGRK